MIRETGRTLLRTLLRICEDRIFASRVSWYWDIRIIIRMSGILESAKKIEKWSGVSRDTFLRDNPRWEISPNVLAMHFHQFSPLRMEEIRNDYTRDCEIQRGGERYSAWFRNMNRWMKSGEKQDLAGVENRKREIGDGEKDRWRALRKGNSFSCKISVTKSWSTRIDFVFGFDRKILGERNKFLDLSRCLTRSITRSTNYEEEGGGRSTLEDGRNSLVDGGTTPVLFRIINFSMEVLSKGWRPELNWTRGCIGRNDYENGELRGEGNFLLNLTIYPPE